MKRVLLTGANGFIGRHAIPFLLENGYEVHCIDISHPDVQLKKVACWHQVDLLDDDRLNAMVSRIHATHLLHFAWFSKPGEYWTSMENLRWVRASLTLLQAFKNHGGERVVMAGTCAEYDWNFGCCSELLTPLVPNTFYGTCKHSLQLMLSAFSKETSISAAWGRIFFLYGPFEHPNRLVSSIIHSLLIGEPALCSHGNQIRDFLYVEDVANAFVTLLKSNITGAVNIASGHPVNLGTIIKKIAEKIGHVELIQLGALTTPPDEPHILIANVDRLHNDVKWMPKYDLDSGLEETINWWRRLFPSKT